MRLRHLISRGRLTNFSFLPLLCFRFGSHSEGVEGRVASGKLVPRFAILVFYDRHHLMFTNHCCGVRVFIVFLFLFRVRGFLQHWLRQERSILLDQSMFFFRCEGFGHIGRR